MNHRQEKIIFRLATSQAPLTSQQLADALGVSIRTVKYEMGILKGELEKIGAALVSRRNVGYWLQVQNKSLFSPFFETLSVKQYFRGQMDWDENDLLLNLMRHLVAVGRAVPLEELAQALYISRSTLQLLLKKAVPFLQSYHLQVTVKPGKGVLATGQEQHLRLAMTELYSYYHHKIDLDDADEAYTHWLACDEAQRQNIRHTFLRVLRESEVSVVDLISQRLSLYLIIARNRWRAGYAVRLPAAWRQQIATCDVYPVAQRIFAGLAAAFPGYDVAEDEICFVAIVLLCHRDMGHLAPRQAHAPFLYHSCVDLTGVIFAELRARYNVEFNRFSWTETELHGHLLVIMAKKHFALDGMQYFETTHDRMIFNSPVSVGFAYIVIRCIEHILDTTLTMQDKIKLAYFMYEIMAYVDYDIKKLNLLLVSNMGIAFTKVLELRLTRRYPQLIQSCTGKELYEIRGLDFSQYDAVISDSGRFLYQYHLPYDNLHLITRPQELNKIFDSIMIGAYQYRQYLPAPALISVHRDFDYQRQGQFFQFICYRHCAEGDDRQAMKEHMTRCEQLLPQCPSSGTAVVFGFHELARTQAIELYRLKKTGSWNGHKIDAILYICLDWNNSLHRIKLLENCFRMMEINPACLDLLESDPENAFDRVMRRYLSQNWTRELN